MPDRKTNRQSSNFSNFSIPYLTDCARKHHFLYLEGPIRFSFCIFRYDSWTFCCICLQILVSENWGARQKAGKNLTLDFSLPYCSSGPKKLKLLNLGRRESGIWVVQRFSLLLEIKLAGNLKLALVYSNFLWHYIWFHNLNSASISGTVC